MKNTVPTTHWITQSDVLITDPAAHGFAESDCGPNMLTDNAYGYCVRIETFRVRVSAIDGGFSKTRKSLEAIRSLCVEYGFIYPNGTPADGGVSSDGIARFGGIEYRTADSKIWHPLPIGLNRLAALS